MGTLEEIRVMWEEWKAIPFPTIHAGDEVGGVCVTTLDTFAAGCIDTFISRKGRLDKRRAAVLEECKQDLEIVVKNFDGEAQAYFRKLLLICDKALAMMGSIIERTWHNKFCS